MSDRSDSDSDWIWIDPGEGLRPDIQVQEGQPYRIGFLQYPDKPEAKEPDRFKLWREFRERTKRGE